MNVLTVFSYIPAIISVIKAIEEAIPGKDQGEAKLAAVREMLEAVDEGFTKYMPTVEKIVAALVSLFNKTGWGK